MRISDWSSDVCSSDLTTALALDRLPRSLLVIGGGVIGVELGQMFARFGVEVTICCRSRLLPEMDPEVSTALQTYLEAEGVRVCTGIGYQRIANAVNGIELTCESRSCDGEDCSDTVRSEEHTSELQSLMRISYAVFCL